MLKRKNVLFLFAFFCIILFCFACGSKKEEAKQTIVLSYANFPPAPTFPCVQMERWKEEVERRTNGLVSIKTYPGGTLLGAKEMMDGVIAGQADIGNLCMAYQPGRFVLTNATSLPLGLLNAKIASLVLWDIYNKYKPEAFDKVKVLTMFATAPANIMSKKPVRNLDDIKGMNLRGSGNAVEILKAWNANAVGMPMSAVPEALQKGTIQGLFSSLEVMKDFKFAEICKYATMTDVVIYPFAVVMNKDKWNSLPKKVQKVMDDLAREQAEWTGSYMDRHVQEAIKWSKETHNVEFINLSPEEKANWDNKLQFMVDDWVNANKNIHGDQIVQDIKTFSKKYSEK